MADKLTVNPITGLLDVTYAPTIGDTVVSGTANRVLFLDNDGKLQSQAATSTLKWADPATYSGGVLEVRSNNTVGGVGVTELVIANDKAAANNREWYFLAQGPDLYWGLINDARNSGDNYAHITRNGAVATKFELMYGHTSEVDISDAAGLTGPNAVFTDVLGTGYPSAHDAIQGKGIGSGGYGTSNIFAARQASSNLLCAGMDLAPWLSLPYGIFNAYGDASDTGAGYVRFLEFNINDRSQEGDKRRTNLLVQALDTDPTNPEWTFYTAGGYMLSATPSNVFVGGSLSGGNTPKGKLHVIGGIDDGQSGTSVGDPTDVSVYEDTYSYPYSSYDETSTVEFLYYDYVTAPDSTVVYSATPGYWSEYIDYGNGVWSGYGSSLIHTWTRSTGAEGTVILRSINGSGYNEYLIAPNDVTPSQYDDYYSFVFSYPSWQSGNPVVTQSPYGGVTGSSTALRTENGDVKFFTSGTDTTPVFRMDATNKRIGINNAAPEYALDVTGDSGVSAQFRSSNDDNTFVIIADSSATSTSGYSYFGHSNVSGETVTTLAGPSTTKWFSATKYGGDAVPVFASGAYFSSAAFDWGTTPPAAGDVWCSGSLGVGSTTLPSGNKLMVELDTTDYTNTNGENTHILLNNPNASGQLSMMAYIGGNPMMKFRSDYVGDLSWIAYPANNTAGHYFIVGGDYPVGKTKMKIANNGITIGDSESAANPAAYLTLGAGAAAQYMTPLKFTSGTLNTTPIAGAVEFLTDKWYATITTGTARKEVTLNDAALTSGRIPCTTTNGRLTDYADLTFDGTTLIFNDSGSAKSIRAESDTNANMFYMDGTNNRVGVGVAPSYHFDSREAVTNPTPSFRRTFFDSATLTWTSGTYNNYFINFAPYTEVVPSGGTTIQNVRAVSGEFYNNGAGTVTTGECLNFTAGNLSSGTITNLYLANIGIYSSGAGNITTAAGLRIGNLEATAGAGTVTTAYGINITAQTAAKGTSKYGLYIDDISGAATNNYAIYTKAGDIRLGGAITVAAYTRHIQVPAMLSGTPANQPTEVDFGTVSGLQFATTGSKAVFGQFEIPDDWDGTNIILEVDWFPDSGAMSGTDTVEWILTYRSIAEGESCQLGTVATVTVTDSADYAQYVTKHSQFTLTFNHADQPLTKQDHVFFKLTRNTGVTNDFGGTVSITEFELVYNSVGLPRI